LGGGGGGGGVGVWVSVPPALAHVGRVGVCGERGLIMKEIKTVKAVWSWAGSSPYGETHLLPSLKSPAPV